MVSPLESLIKTGSKLWLDSIDPDLVVSNYAKGATGATSNPIIIANLIKTGRFDDQIKTFKSEGLNAHDATWAITNQMVTQAEEVFLPVFEKTAGNDGYVSFEVDPLLEDLKEGPEHGERVSSYVALAKKWAENHPNRLIKVPATPAGIDALEDMVAAGVNVNVTLIFSDRQYIAARDAVWAGAQRRPDLSRFKSVFSIFVSRLDVYAGKQHPELPAETAGQVGILNAKRVWELNNAFWSDKNTPLQQEMIFASTGTKKPEDPKWKYVAAFAGSDIETNPPETNDAVEASGQTFDRQIDKLPDADTIATIDRTVNWQHLEETLMAEGLEKFAEPQKALLALVDSI
ncbi:MAG: transaldolase [Pseudobacteriovorax sp.]|nr:transaldolase [Pseudobacteriovorax sp.]